MDLLKYMNILHYISVYVPYNFIYQYINNMNKNPTDATVCRYLFTAKLLYMFRVSQHPSSGVLNIVPAASGTGHTTCTATPLQRGLIGTGLCESHATRTNLMMGAVTPETCRVVLQ